MNPKYSEVAKIYRKGLKHLRLVVFHKSAHSFSRRAEWFGGDMENKLNLCFQPYPRPEYLLNHHFCARPPKPFHGQCIELR